MGMGVVRSLILGLHVTISALLITLVVMQTQREQGIMGLFGQGPAPTKTRGLGVEETLKVWTRRLAITFFITSIALVFFQGFV